MTKKNKRGNTNENSRVIRITKIFGSKGCMNDQEMEIINLRFRIKCIEGIVQTGIKDMQIIKTPQKTRNSVTFYDIKP